MKYNEIVGLETNVSEMGFGLWTLSTHGWGSITLEGASNILNEAFSLGVNLFDTADSYGNGYSEELIAEALSTVRKNIVISTKVGVDFYHSDVFGEDSNKKNFSPDYLIYSCEQSLRRLKTDYIDLFQMHYPNLTDVESDGAFEALERLKEQGKILSWGSAIEIDSDSREVCEILVSERDCQFFQLPYNPIEIDMLRTIEDNSTLTNLSIIARRTHFYGLLDSTFDRNMLLENKELLGELGGIGNPMKFVDKFIKICMEFDLDPEVVALRFPLQNQLVSAILPNITDSETLREFIGGLEENDLPEEITDLINDLMS